MSENKKISYVTKSKLKFNEASYFFKSRNVGFELVQNEAELFEVQTKDPRDIKALVLHKGKQAWDKTGHAALVEYTGLFLSKYGNFPGSLTKHVFNGIGYRGLFRLVDSGDSAIFTSFLAYVDKYGNANVFEGRQEGQIVKPEKLEINAEFPFDQIFVPQEQTISLEELKKEGHDISEEVSYRTASLIRLIQYLKKGVIT